MRSSLLSPALKFTNRLALRKSGAILWLVPNNFAGRPIHSAGCVLRDSIDNSKPHVLSCVYAAAKKLCLRCNDCIVIVPNPHVRAAFATTLSPCNVIARCGEPRTTAYRVPGRNPNIWLVKVLDWIAIHSAFPAAIEVLIKLWAAKAHTYS